MIPWVLSDSNYVVHTAQRLDNETTVFVGALHGMLNAEGLAHVMNDLFGNVVYAGVDTDKYKYPIGRFSVYLSFWVFSGLPLNVGKLVLNSLAIAMVK